jgi:protease I
MASILIPIPEKGFDPSEVAVPWKIWSSNGHKVTFATPDGEIASTDERMLTGNDLRFLKPVLMANRAARTAYSVMTDSDEFREPIRYASIDPADFDAMLLPGGHAKEVRPYLESQLLQQVTVDMFARDTPVAAVCHGVIVAARATRPDGTSVLHGRKTTSLTKAQELLAWRLTRRWLDDYYLTYPITVEDEVRGVLASPQDYLAGPPALLRDSATNTRVGFCVVDGNYVSARWPGDIHRLAYEFDRVLRDRRILSR